MPLSKQQLDALKNGQPVPVIVGETECVVVRKDVFQTLRQGEYDDGEWTEAEMSAAAVEMFDGLDNPDTIE